MFFRSLFLLLKAFGKIYDFRRLSHVFAYVTTISEDFHSLEHSITKISEAFERCYDDES